MIKHRVQAREHDLAIRSERVLGALRVAGGLVGAGLLFVEDDHPSLVWEGELTQWLLFLAVGVATLLVTGRRRPGPWIMPFRRLTLGLDAVVLLSQIPLHAYVGTHVDPSPALLVPLLGGIKMAYRGLSQTMLGLVFVELVWMALAVGRFGTSGAMAIKEIALNLIMGLALGVLAAHLAHTAREGRDRADLEAERAEEAAFSAATARAEIEALHDMLRSSLGLSEAAAAEAMAATLARAVEGDVILTLDPDIDGDRPRTVTSRRLPHDVEPLVCSADIGPAEAPIGKLEVRTAHVAPDDEVMRRLADQVAVGLQAARQLDQQARLAERHRELERLKTDFVSITSHELRTPLGAISAGADTLFERGSELDDETQRTLLAAVARNAERLRRLVEDLLVVGRFDAGVLSFESRPVPVDVLVREAIDDCDGLPVQVAGGPDVLADADPMRVNQILVNLLTNADAHGAAPVEVAWHSVGRAIIIEVTDRGQGIAPGDRERVFDRFVQLGAMNQHSEGTGLGLPIARDLARAMGGDVHLSSTGTLTTATLRLPAATAGNAARTAVQDDEPTATRASVG